jgi:hypothetical protein
MVTKAANASAAPTLTQPPCHTAGRAAFSARPMAAPAKKPPTCATMSDPSANPINTKIKKPAATPRKIKPRASGYFLQSEKDCTESIPNAPVTIPDAPRLWLSSEWINRSAPLPAAPARNAASIATPGP